VDCTESAAARNPDPSEIPAELRSLARWIPIDRNGSCLARTATSFDAALAVLDSEPAAVRLALRLAPDDPYTVVELHDALAPDGEPTVWAKAWLSHLDDSAHVTLADNGRSLFAVVRGRPETGAFAGDYAGSAQAGAGILGLRLHGGLPPAFGATLSTAAVLPDLSPLLSHLWTVCMTRSAPPRSRDAPVDYSAMSDEALGIVQVRDVVVKRTDWLWRHRLARGELNLLAGNGGEGKTQLILYFAACISKGADWPDGSGKAPFGRTIIVSAEDDPETTLVPRLMAMGADLANVTIVKARTRIEKPGEPAMVNPMSLQDRDYFATILDRFKDTVLLAIDPLPSYLGRGTDDAKNQELRRVVEPFIDEVTRPRKVAVLANSHLNKSSATSTPVHRILGSVAYVNLARVVQMVVRDKNDPGRKLMSLAKCNIAPGDVPALAYRIESRTVQDADGEDIETAVPVFEAEGVVVDLEDHLAGSKGSSQKASGPSPTKRVEVAEWLVGYLQTRPSNSARLAELVDEAGELGFLGAPAFEAGGMAKYKTTTPLYRAKDAVPRLAAPLDGLEVVSSNDDPTVNASKDGKARWVLRRISPVSATTDAPAAAPATLPFRIDAHD